MREFLHFLEPRPSPEMMVFITQVLVRLLLAALLGGAIGFERELKHKPAGLRTLMFICFGCAFFTILSDKLAGDMGGDHTRIAAQIIPGIGFLGAGSILHSKTGTSGVTTAAVIFVVASIGMATGGGLFLPAIVATIIILLALLALGAMETRWNLKPFAVCYELEASNAEDLVAKVNNVLTDENRTMRSVELMKTDGHYRMNFCVDALRTEHDALSLRLRSLNGTQQFQRTETTESDQ
jgi:putative Mg2+ transporter-C (MgtC) family protein